MSGPISIYLRDETLDKLDAVVKQRAQDDREKGLSGRQVTNRSQVIEQAIEAYLAEQAGLSVEEIRYAVVSLAEERGAKRVSLFGSFARGEATSASDVDILLEKGRIKGLEVIDFQDALAQRLRRQVDVVTTAGASERFLSKISEDQIVLYEAG